MMPERAMFLLGMRLTARAAQVYVSVSLRANFADKKYYMTFATIISISNSI